MSDIQPHKFSINDLPFEKRNQVQIKTDLIKGLLRKSAEEIIEVGSYLAEVKDLLDHGQWLGWLKAEFAWSEDTARNFMRVSKRFKSRIITDLYVAPTVLYLLAAPSTPQQAIDEVLSRAKQGEPITVEAARQIVDKAKPKPALRPPSSPAAPASSESAAPADPNWYQTWQKYKASLRDVTVFATVGKADSLWLALEGDAVRVAWILGIKVQKFTMPGDPFPVRECVLLEVPEPKPAWWEGMYRALDGDVHSYPEFDPALLEIVENQLTISRIGEAVPLETPETSAVEGADVDDEQPSQRLTSQTNPGVPILGNIIPAWMRFAHLDQSNPNGAAPTSESTPVSDAELLNRLHRGDYDVPTSQSAPMSITPINPPAIADPIELAAENARMRAQLAEMEIDLEAANADLANAHNHIAALADRIDVLEEENEVLRAANQNYAELIGNGAGASGDTDASGASANLLFADLPNDPDDPARTYLLQAKYLLNRGMQALREGYSDHDLSETDRLILSHYSQKAVHETANHIGAIARVLEGETLAEIRAAAEELPNLKNGVNTILYRLDRGDYGREMRIKA